jgi:hypothetical protein
MQNNVDVKNFQKIRIYLLLQKTKQIESKSKENSRNSYKAFTWVMQLCRQKAW